MEDLESDLGFHSDSEDGEIQVVNVSPRQPPAGRRAAAQKKMSYSFSESESEDEGASSDYSDF